MGSADVDDQYQAHDRLSYVEPKPFFAAARLSCRFSFRDFWATFLPSFLGFEAPFIVTSSRS